MTSPLKAFKSRSLIDAIRGEFLEELTRPRAGLALIADKQEAHGDWGDFNLTWDELSEMEAVQISMDLPPVRAESIGSTQQSVESPIWTGDLKWGGRKWRSFLNSWRRRQVIARETGADFEMPSAETKFINKKAKAILNEINKQILNGSGSSHPGSTNGLLNHSGIITISGGNWLDPDTMNDDLADGIAQARDRRYRGTEWALVHNPADENVLETFMPQGGGARMRDNLQDSISRSLPEEEVAAGEMFLIPDRNIEDAYAWVHPEDDPETGFTFGLGTVNAGRMDNGNDRAMLNGSRQEKVNEFMKTRVVRLLQIGTIVPFRTGTARGTGSGTVKLTFSTA